MEAGLIHGEVHGTRTVLMFQGRTLDALRCAFADTLADDREWCAAHGKAPDRL